jgi:formylglycine-generating enzyme required for sulfatase activity
MPSTLHSPHVKDPVVRIHSLDKHFHGTGCLTHHGLLVTCAHVVRNALNPPRIEGEIPTGRLWIDFPFLSGKPGMEVEVAPGGWGWFDDQELSNDIAILQLLSAPPRVDPPSYPPQSAITGEHDGVAHGFTDLTYDDYETGGFVLGKLSSNAKTPNATYAWDHEGSAHIPKPGFSGATVFDASRSRHVGSPLGMIISKPNQGGSLVDSDRIVYIIPADLIRRWIEAVLDEKAKRNTEQSSAELQEAAAIIPELLTALENVALRNDPRIHDGLVLSLEDLQEKIHAGIDPAHLDDFVDTLHDFDHFRQEASETELGKLAKILSLSDVFHALDAFRRRCHMAGAEVDRGATVCNDWTADEEQVPHHAERKALLEAITARLTALKAGGIRIAADRVRRAETLLKRLRLQLHKNPLELRVVDEVRAELERLDRSLFYELIVNCQIFLARHADRLPDFACFRDFAEAPEMVVIPAGTFMMGSPDDDEKRFDDEGPRQEMTIPDRIALGRTPVTFDEWDFFARTDPTKHHRPGDGGWGRERRPVIDVNWEDTKSYLAWLSQRTGKDYRLPSEAEWEYCCRARTHTSFYFADSEDELGKFAWYDANSENKTQPVGQRTGNEFGLYDMHGNVFEWCDDVWHRSDAGKPEELKANGGSWKTGGDQSAHVIRGGSWNYGPRFLRSAFRVDSLTGDRKNNIGFRIARTLTSVH